MLRKLILAAVLVTAAHAARAEEPDAITRLIGYDMLRQVMTDHINTPIDWTPPGYFMIGYDVRVG